MAVDPRLDHAAVLASTAEQMAPDQQLTCPRCSEAATMRFYGPCEACRDDLRAGMAGEQRTVEAPAYEPKMNVTPNAVATKD